MVGKPTESKMAPSWFDGEAQLGNELETDYHCRFGLEEYSTQCENDGMPRIHSVPTSVQNFLIYFLRRLLRTRQVQTGRSA